MRNTPRLRRAADMLNEQVLANGSTGSPTLEHEQDRIKYTHTKNLLTTCNNVSSIVSRAENIAVVIMALSISWLNYNQIGIL